MTNPLTRRLQTDYEKVKKLAAESGGTLKLIKTVGFPPTEYQIEYHCPGLEKDNKGNIIVRQQHTVEISLSSGYPFAQPQVYILTPVFNPHVFPSNRAVCLGMVWNPGETLDLLILKIGALLQLDPKVLDAKSPANSEANQWVRANPSRIPLGKVSFKGSPPASRVQWE